MSELAGKRPGPDKEVELGGPRKKGRKAKDRKEAHETVEASPSDYVAVIPYRKPAADDDVGPTVLLSKLDKAAGLVLSEDRLSVTGSKGFRTVRATHGFHAGTHYCEATVVRLGPTGHCRLGWATKRAEVNSPVGYDAHGFSYRDLAGSKVHKAWRDDGYGEPYGEGDVIGLFLHLPPGGRPLEARSAEVVRYKGLLYQVQEEQQEPSVLHGSVAAFTKNGVLQGIAYRDLLEGTYYPATSLFTLPQQTDGACVSFNFGPQFKYAPPAVEDSPAAEPVAVLPARYAEAAAAAAAAAMAPAEKEAAAADGDTAAAPAAVAGPEAAGVGNGTAAAAEAAAVVPTLADALGAGGDEMA